MLETTIEILGWIWFIGMLASSFFVFGLEIEDGKTMIGMSIDKIKDEVPADVRVIVGIVVTIGILMVVLWPMTILLMTRKNIET